MKFLSIVAALLATTACSTETRVGPSGEVRNLTGTHTRVVWVQQDGTDPFAAGDKLALVGFDTEDGRGERAILAERGSYVKPLLTPTGRSHRVLAASDAPEGPEVFIVNWDGIGPQVARAGIRAGDLGQSGRRTGMGLRRHRCNKPEQDYDFATVTRVAIDDPNTRELVWNKSLVSGDTFQVSADGRYAGGLFPWPQAGVAELPNGNLRTLGDGCWTAMSTVRGPIMWYFDGSHRNLTLVDVRSDKRWVGEHQQGAGIRQRRGVSPALDEPPALRRDVRPVQPRRRQPGPQRWRADRGLPRAVQRRTIHRSKPGRASRPTPAGDSYPDVWIDRRKSPHQTAPADGSLGPPRPAQASTQSASTASAGRRAGS